MEAARVDEVCAHHLHDLRPEALALEGIAEEQVDRRVAVHRVGLLVPLHEPDRLVFEQDDVLERVGLLGEEVIAGLLPPAHHARVAAQLQQPLAVLGRDRHELDPRAPQIVAGAPNSCSTSGTATVPSSRWWFSAIAMIVRPTATAVPLSVCTGRGDAPSSGR